MRITQYVLRKTCFKHNKKRLRKSASEELRTKKNFAKGENYSIIDVIGLRIYAQRKGEFFGKKSEGYGYKTLRKKR